MKTTISKDILAEIKEVLPHAPYRDEQEFVSRAVEEKILEYKKIHSWLNKINLQRQAPKIDILLDLAKKVKIKGGPKDLSAKFDDYLYGE